ncbi:RimK family protein [Lichenifustis flavocetrariae]|uniref:RimK family protein n=1 Tax=Lichenifustis flavocetrariae TaxID=2949735 RepID=A0AA41Z4M0_9HYPH|nr:RimK family protein [Lichenifustis flavocetrariae]MCW6510388.1 RimK family protein [Lichenifustis flavocetrariae]
MTDWVILVDQERDFPNADTPHKVITTRDYLARPKLFSGASRAKVVNLSRSYDYQSSGYYASLLAEARGHRIIPTVETMLELRERKLYEHALPELEHALARCAQKAKAHDDKDFELLCCFGAAQDTRFEAFGRLLFDWFRCPALRISVTVGERWRIERIRPCPLQKLQPRELRFFRDALEQHTQRSWRGPKARPVAKYSIAVLHDPHEKMPPSSPETLRHLARIGEKMAVAIEPITKKQLAELAEFDALFIRATTSIDDYTYRFARRALQEGMPVIDDPVSMIRCTNKVYLHELLQGKGIPVPPTVMLADDEDLDRAEAMLGWPMVVKDPDGSFSRGVHKVADRAALRALTGRLFEDTDLLLAQKYMPTAFDWRLGVLDGEPLFLCQYHMAKGHWQIIKHGENGAAREGSHTTVAIADAPPAVLQTGLAAARAIGSGLYGVDLKETPEGGVVVIEINDNPNLDHGVEDQVGKDEIWTKLLGWFITRIDR